MLKPTRGREGGRGTVDCSRSDGGRRTGKIEMVKVEMLKAEMLKWVPLFVSTSPASVHELCRCWPLPTRHLSLVLAGQNQGRKN
jgi:hypothetical protein